MDKDKIKVNVSSVCKTYEIERDFKSFMKAHIGMLGEGYNAEGVWLGVSEKIEITKNEFKIITDEEIEITYTLVK